MTPELPVGTGKCSFRALPGKWQNADAGNKELWAVSHHM
jgi:hypothetical protein